MYMLPTIMGCLIMLIWYPLMLWQNDGRFTSVEILVVFVEIVLCVIIALYQYIIYRVSMRRGEKVVMTNAGI